MSHPAKPSIKHTEKIKHFHVHKECLAMAKCPSSEKKKALGRSLNADIAPLPNLMEQKAANIQFVVFMILRFVHYVLAALTAEPCTQFGP